MKGKQDYQNLSNKSHCVCAFNHQPAPALPIKSNREQRSRAMVTADGLKLGAAVLPRTTNLRHLQKLQDTSIPS